MVQFEFFGGEFELLLTLRPSLWLVPKSYPSLCVENVEDWEVAQERGVTFQDQQSPLKLSASIPHITFQN